MDTQFCELVIAIHKEAYTKATLTNNIPRLLKHIDGKSYEDALYWRFYDIEWTSTQRELTDFFQFLSEESHVNIYVTQPGQVKVPLYSKECYAALRLGEAENDCESWGSPDDYAIGFKRELSVPDEIK